jgi:CRP/FNR family transcriptional regulator, cyclic AMP receptor protein
MKKINRFYFKIIAANNCPLYEQGDLLSLSDRALYCPKKKAACLILVREMTSLLFTLLDSDSEADEKSDTIYSCSGCLGLIKFNLISAEKASKGEPISSVPFLAFTDKEVLTAIREHPLIQAIPAPELFRAVSCFRKERLPADSTIITKGQLSLSLYLLLSGQMVVSDDSLIIASIGPGDICGEMSYFGGGIAGADVRTVKETVVLSISTNAFSKLIDDIPELQFFMAQTLAKRLNQANIGHVDAFGAGMCGRLNEMPPAELMQVLHMHRKTGVLDFEFSQDGATVFFLEGEVVGACYREKKDTDAFNAVLQETEGRYTYTAGLSPEMMEASEIGAFMVLLMEGVGKLDESGGDLRLGELKE